MAYNLLQPVQVISVGDMSADITSPTIETKLQDNIGIQLVWLGAPVGIFYVEVSIDHKEDAQKNVTVPGTWQRLDFCPSITAAGVPDDAIIELNQLTFAYIRIKYKSTSGTGVLSAIVTGRAV